MITTVIFDLFGTLLEMEHDSHPFVQLARRTSKMSVKEALHLSLINECNSLSDYSSLIGLPPQNDIQLLESQLKNDISSAQLYNDTISTLETLKNRGLKLVLISNLATPYKQVVASLKLDKYFMSTVYSCDTGYCKPGTTIYELGIISAFSLPSQTLMIGDSFKSDVEGPSYVGIKGIQLIRDNYIKPNEFEISSLEDVIKLI